VGNFGKLPDGYRVDLNKEAVSRRYVFETMPAEHPSRTLQFLDVGGRDGKLTYLLGHRTPLQCDSAFYATNKARFNSLYEYFGVDLTPAGDHVLAGDICNLSFLERYKAFVGRFDVIYSNNVFEHLEKPWVAAEVLFNLLAPGGICITIVPFSQRFHESPTDFFRYTHTAIEKLFSAVGPIEVLETGYDLRARRFNWQGGGTAKDIVPVDKYGAWRETWFTVTIVRKLAS
jgi:SAM-dependent methyltransferase